MAKRIASRFRVICLVEAKPWEKNFTTITRSQDYARKLRSRDYASVGIIDRETGQIVENYLGQLRPTYVAMRAAEDVS